MGGIAPKGAILRGKEATKTEGAIKGQSNAKRTRTLNHVGSIISHIMFGWNGIFGCDLNALKAKKPLVDS